MNTDHLSRANQQFHNKNYQAALNSYNLAIQHCPSIPEAYYHRGLVKRILGNHQEAIQDLSIAVLLNPQMVLAFYYRGITYYEIGDFPYALANYNHAIMLEPKLANAYYHRAIIYGELGLIPQGIKDFTQAASLAKEQNNFYLYKKSKNAQVLAKKLKGSNRYNKALLAFFKISLLATIAVVTIGNLKYFKNNLNEVEIPGKSIIDNLLPKND